METKIIIQEVDKDVYELRADDDNYMYVSGQQLRDLKDKIDDFFEELLNAETEIILNSMGRFNSHIEK